MSVNKTCEKCGKRIPWRVEIDGIKKMVRGRKFCLVCSPWGGRNVKDLTISDEEREQRRKQQNREKSKRYHYRHPDKQKQKREERKKRLIETFGGKCEICGYDKCIACLDFHHKDSNTKIFSFSVVGLLIKWERLIEEAKKCSLLCSNCHGELHYAERRRAEEIGS